MWKVERSLDWGEHQDGMKSKPGISGIGRHNGRYCLCKALPGTRAFPLRIFLSLRLIQMLVSRLRAGQRACARAVQFSTAVHPQLHLTPVSDQDVAHFAKFLAPNSIISTLAPSPSPADELETFNNDWMGRFHGRSTTVLKPKTTQEVSEILKWCNQRRIGVVPQGGNTGLVGGSVPIDNEVILSLAALNKVRSFDPVSGQYIYSFYPMPPKLTNSIYQAFLWRMLGVSSKRLQIMSLRITTLCPLIWVLKAGKSLVFSSICRQLSVHHSCQIGGNVATNAGGLRLLRYGSLHGTVLGLEVVLPDGRILDQLTTLRKDNTGMARIHFDSLLF